MKLASPKVVASLVIVVVIVGALAGVVAAEQRPLLLGVQCRYNPAGRLVVRLSTGETVESVRLYSEPSHHLLAALADLHWAETPDGQAFVASARGEHPEKDPVVLATMVGAELHIEGWSEDPPPTGDNAVKAFVRTTRDPEERLGIYTHVNVHREFGTEVRE